jgi:hypothetical protein
MSNEEKNEYNKVNLFQVRNAQKVDNQKRN